MKKFLVSLDISSRYKSIAAYFGPKRKLTSNKKLKNISPMSFSDEFSKQILISMLIPEGGLLIGGSYLTDHLNEISTDTNRQGLSCEFKKLMEVVRFTQKTLMQKHLLFHPRTKTHN